MSKISQRQAVESATATYFGENFQSGVDVKTYATKEDQRAIATAVAEAMLANEVELSADAHAKYATSLENLVSKYVMGMVKNWFNKSPNLNGGQKYEAKNPGSRTNPELKALKSLLAQTTDQVAIERIQVEIARIESEVQARKASKTKEVKIDANLIPESLRDLVA